MLNLSNMAEELAQIGGHPSLVRSIRDAVAAHSLVTDMQLAEASCNKLKSILSVAANEKDASDSIVGSALLMQSVILYCRATKTTSKIRKTFDIRSALTPAQKIIHKEICDLRDLAFAHFGHGGSCRLLLLEEAAVQHENGNIGFIGRRLVADGQLVERLSDMIGVAFTHLKDVENTKAQYMATQLQQAMNLSEVVAVATNHIVDLSSTGLSLQTIAMIQQAVEEGREARGMDASPTRAFASVLKTGQSELK